MENQVQKPTETLVPTETLDKIAYLLRDAGLCIEGRDDFTKRVLEDLATAQKVLFKALGYRMEPGD